MSRFRLLVRSAAFTAGCGEAPESTSARCGADSEVDEQIAATWSYHKEGHPFTTPARGLRAGR